MPGKTPRQARCEEFIIAPSRTFAPVFWLLSCACFGALLGTSHSKRTLAASPNPYPAQAILVGGGPDIDNNQAAIEGNIRYLNRLMSPGTPRTVLFADGSVKSETVLYDVEPDSGAKAQRMWEMLFDSERPEPDSWVATRAPRLNARLDGASNEKSIAAAFSKIRSTSPLLLFFTGHGSDNERDLNNNSYNLWGDEELTVREMAKNIARLPRQTPVTLVMVQCYSGAFGNVIFQNGDPKAALVERDIAGFFAATNDRVAAGCTSEVNEAEYHDFTSYFFAALTGRDRVGRRVVGADYNRDGHVGGDEAFAYTLARDKSIDVPTSTSDVFLRRFAKVSAAQRTSTRWSQLREWASPAQRAALDSLAKELGLTGENRLQQARQQLVSERKTSLFADMRRAFDQGRLEGRKSGEYETARDAARERVFKRWPKLAQASSRASQKKTVLLAWETEIEAGQWSDLLNADAALTQVEMAQSQDEEKQEIAQAHLLRLARLGDSILLRRNLQKGSNAKLKARLTRLLRAESRPILPPVAQLR